MDMLGVLWFNILNWYWLLLFLMFVVFFVFVLVEINCLLFDLVEVELELVVGFMVEYGFILYMMFMFGEYVVICLMCVLMVIFFMGGWLFLFDFVLFIWVLGVVWFFLKCLFGFFMFVMVKVMVLCYCYD